jgi:glycosyltransferase involved in cell wall biosynthesis
LCPISKKLEGLAKEIFPEISTVFSPMGIVVVEKDEIEFKDGVAKHYKNENNLLTFGYFGKISPNGKSKGFEEILDFLAKLMKLEVSFQMKFVGVLKSELTLLESAISVRKLTRVQIEVTSHIPHLEALSLMEGCDFLLLPTNQDKEYQGFPIKAIEYAYSGRAILASDSQVNRDVFSGPFQPYWYEAGNPSSIILALEDAQNDEKLVGRVVSGHSFAKDFDWKVRTSNILTSAKDLLLD